MRPEAVAAMTPFLAEHPGNPSGAHGASRATKTALEYPVNARIATLQPTLRS